MDRLKILLRLKGGEGGLGYLRFDGLNHLMFWVDKYDF